MGQCDVESLRSILVWCLIIVGVLVMLPNTPEKPDDKDDL